MKMMQKVWTVGDSYPGARSWGFPGGLEACNTT